MSVDLTDAAHRTNRIRLSAFHEQLNSAIVQRFTTRSASTHDNFRDSAASFAQLSLTEPWRYVEFQSNSPVLTAMV
ncbi:hypothetical protein ACIQYW_32325 [Rhodococcus erythropolis]|uniref:hypothetical protein n=1 Tax=Rhodococcus TaxID=1827 RepID=UPI0014201FBF|nr:MULTISPECIES: hypothetical protein [Rhodococcus]NHP17015.1 hypothetical protein [Rhodococcus sp. IC4_135]MBJ7478301.1 hypothetical protein [Rhodococcus sp. (in: high G+C Gram-positive bacteria)]MDI9956737.1 hypothetical protein [Rhodococcus sp. IEGM 1237]MDI9962723.1 hypothetical protein [Rhodococcus sp. IEGM 1251]MDV8128907.1 hypothetical protein [Rhodococcus sp. IEGM 1304]